ncbi:hypothetical protein [Spirillospora sp. CA-128828]|uniref:hypothetical protein n=1 Tax=Spirillospora sp. CA-128828 TaxID=3240033 RepID=UPI003D8A8102
MTILDKIVIELDALTGKADQTYDGFCARVAAETAQAFPGGWVGFAIPGGVIGELRDLLRRAESRLSPSERGEIRSSVVGIQGLRKFDQAAAGPQPPVPGHGWGFCLDISGGKAPYLIHERGEHNLDLAIGPVYHAIARTMLHRDSVIPSLGQSAGPNVADVYDRLREESEAFKTYFRFMMMSLSDIDAFARANPHLGLPAAILLKPAVVAHWTHLANRPGFVLNDLTGLRDQIYPLPTLPRVGAPGMEDRPFTGGDPGEGFLDHLPRSLVMALTAEGMDWGACHLGAESGDLMHFQFTRGAFDQQLKLATQRARP